MKVENPANSDVEIKEYANEKSNTDKTGNSQCPLNSVFMRLLFEMKELRGKYSKNFLELENMKEKLQAANEARKIQQTISATERCVIASLMSENKVLKEFSRISIKMIDISRTEHTLTYEQLLAARTKIGSLEAKTKEESDSKQSKVKSKKKEECDFFEVEKLLNHKNVRKVRHFLVRWKGFGPQFDSWQKEVDLNCPDLLQAYIKKTKLKK